MNFVEYMCMCYMSPRDTTNISNQIDLTPEDIEKYDQDRSVW